MSQNLGRQSSAVASSLTSVIERATLARSS